jgi:fatty acid desaturase
MNPRVVAVLRESQPQELFATHQKLRVRRNLGIIAFLVALVILFWSHAQGWIWFLPPAVGLLAAGQQVQMLLITEELKQGKGKLERVGRTR